MLNQYANLFLPTVIRIIDRHKCIGANSTWSKGYARKGAAIHGLKRWEDAVEAYNAGLKLEDSPALRKGLKEVQDMLGVEPGKACYEFLHRRK